MKVRRSRESCIVQENSGWVGKYVVFEVKRNINSASSHFMIVNFLQWWSFCFLTNCLGSFYFVCACLEKADSYNVHICFVCNVLSEMQYSIIYWMFRFRHITCCLLQPHLSRLSLSMLRIANPRQLKGARLERTPIIKDKLFISRCIKYIFRDRNINIWWRYVYTVIFLDMDIIG